jgi:phytoene dehydrogenase-like protein
MANLYDMIVIGAGHNGLVAAARLAGHGLGCWFWNGGRW